MAEQPTLLALGAHADDCVFGLPGTMLHAVSKGHRVVILNLFGNVRADSEARPSESLEARIAELNGRHGVETRFLPFASGGLDTAPGAKAAVAEVVADLRPATAFYLWPRDRHADHVAAAPICHSALQLAGRILRQPGVPEVRSRYTYDNGPTHTIDFVPNAFVDITAVWEEARSWVGEVTAACHGETYDPETPQPAQRTKEILAAYRGLTCGAAFAEAFHTTAHAPVSILDGQLT